MSEWPYTMVVPALVLRDSPGQRQSARIDFPQPISLGNSFGIEFWFKPDAYPREGATPVLIARLESAKGGARDLVLRLDGQHITPEFQNYHGPLSKPPPLQRWTHIALLYQAGELRVVYWHEGRALLDEGVKLEDEGYRLRALVLASENGATHLFAELRLWRPQRDPNSLASDRERPLDGNEPGLIGYWKLDEGSGTLMVDLRGNDGLIEGGGYVLDSGLALQLGSVVDIGSHRNSHGYTMQPADPPPRWKDPPPAAVQNRYLESLERLKNHEQYAAFMESQVQGPLLDTQFKAARDEISAQQAELEKKKALLEEARRRTGDEIALRRQEIQQKQQDVVKAIETSQKIHLKDFILQLQDDLTRGRERMLTKYGRVYGLDTISMDVKVIPGVAGIGLHLPDPGLRIDPGRLSTLKLRFKARHAEEEEQAKWAAVPLVEGSTEDFARRKLSQAGFRIDVVYQEVADATQEGRILAQIYDAKGDQAQLGAVITLIIGQRQ